MVFNDFSMSVPFNWTRDVRQGVGFASCGPLPRFPFVVRGSPLFSRLSVFSSSQSTWRALGALVLRPAIFLWPWSCILCGADLRNNASGRAGAPRWPIRPRFYKLINPNPNLAKWAVWVQVASNLDPGTPSHPKPNRPAWVPQVGRKM